MARGSIMYLQDTSRLSLIQRRGGSGVEQACCSYYNRRTQRREEELFRVQIVARIPIGRWHSGSSEEI